MTQGRQQAVSTRLRTVHAAAYLLDTLVADIHFVLAQFMCLANIQCSYQMLHTAAGSTTPHQAPPPAMTALQTQLARKGSARHLQDWQLAGTPAWHTVPCWPHLDEADVLGVLPEALTADVQAVLADDTATITAHAAAGRTGAWICQGLLAVQRAGGGWEACFRMGAAVAPQADNCCG